MKNPGRSETRRGHMGSIPVIHINGTGGDTVPSRLKIRVHVRKGNYGPKEHGERDPRAQKIEGARIIGTTMGE